MDGRTRLPLALCLGISALSTGAPAQGEPPSAVTIWAKVRDFKEANPTDPEGTHPHFNTYNACSAQETGAPTVEDELDVAQPSDGQAYPGDERGPRLRADMPEELARCFAPLDRFSDWFQNRDPDVNRAFLTELRFERDPATGMYAFGSEAFFPLDDGSPLRKFDPADPDPFGHLQSGTADGKDLTEHNYGFTMEFHTRIAYEAGRDQRMEFRGDDDIWVFIAGKKVADLGGVHQTQSASVSMDSLAAALGLEDGLDYPMDVYFAERHTASSSLRITANLHLGSVAARPIAGRAAVAAPRLAAGTPVDIFDRGGRLVRSLRATGEASPDRLWDGKDASGRKAAPGLYVWRAQPTATPALTGRVMNGGRFD